MATRSYIAIVSYDDTYNPTYEAIYCHYDGYPEGVGETLLESYSNTAKVRELIALGDISVLAENVAPAEGVAHSFSNAAEGVTIAYGRDRGETRDLSAKKFYSYRELANGAADACAEYLYIWDTAQLHWVYAAVMPYPTSLKAALSSVDA